METLSEAIERLATAGYRDEFRAEPDGVRALKAGCTHAPPSLLVEDIVRFEGESDPGDAAAIFALRCEPHGIRGTYIVAYGPGMDPLDGEAVRQLSDRRRR